MVYLLIVLNVLSAYFQLTLAIDNVESDKSPVVHLLLMILNLAAIGSCVAAIGK